MQHFVNSDSLQSVSQKNNEGDLENIAELVIYLSREDPSSHRLPAITQENNWWLQQEMMLVSQGY